MTIQRGNAIKVWGHYSGEALKDVFYVQLVKYIFYIVTDPLLINDEYFDYYWYNENIRMSIRC